MAVTRINNNQISDASAGNAYVGINAGTKLQPYSITSTKLANNLTYGSDLTVTGNLTVQGNTTAIDTTYTTVEDPILLLASNQTGAPSVDIGFVGQRGTSDNIAFVWDESADEFVTAYTTTGESNTTISIASYADLHTGNATIGGNLTVTGNTTHTGNIIGNLSVSGNIAAGNLLTSGLLSATGNVSGGNLIAAANLVSVGAAVSGNITGGNLLTAGQITATGNITSSANVAGGNVIATANVVSVGAVHTGNVTGGNLLTAGQVSATGNITSSANVQGANVVATANLVSAGAAILGNITGGNLLTAGLVAATGNVSGGNLVAAANVVTVGVVATGNVTGGNLLTAGQITATGNITSSANVQGANVIATANLVSVGAAVSGNITGGNLLTGDRVIATGNVQSSANITGANLVASANLVSVGAVVSGNITGGNLLTAGLVSATSNITSSANIQGANLIATSGITAGTTVVATGNVTGGNLTTAGQVSATGNVTGGNLVTGGQVVATGNIVSSANIAGGNLAVTGTITSATIETTGNVLVGGNLTVQGNIQYINVDDLRVEDPVIIMGTGPNGAPLTTDDGMDRGIYMEYYKTARGNAWVGWENSSGNIIAAANVVFNGNNVVDVNNYGTFQAGNIYAQSAVTTGNITGGNLLTGGLISATGNVTSSANISGGNAIITGNVNGANLNATSGVRAITGYFTGNVDVLGNLNASVGVVYANSGIFYGNAVTGNNAAFAGVPGYTSLGSNVVMQFAGNVNSYSQLNFENINSGTEASTDFIATADNGNDSTNFVDLGIGSSTYAPVAYPAYRSNDAYLLNNGGNLLINPQTAGKVIKFLVGGSANTDIIATLASTGLSITGIVSATGNITGGNVVSNAQVVATGNITSSANISGANVIASANLVSVGAAISGNITGGNLLTGGQVIATGNVQSSANVTGANLVATANVVTVGIVATGNITGGNLLTGGLISATGNITSSANVQGANVIATANLVSVGAAISGNITGGNLLTEGLVTATGNITGGNLITPNLVSATTVTATGNVTGANVNTASMVLNGSNVNSNATRITVNSASSDVDFAVNSDTTANVFYIDAGTSTASFGSSTQTTNAIVAFNATNSVLMPVGNTGQRPATGVTGMMRFNSTLNAVEIYDVSQWSTVGTPSFTVISDDQFNGDGVTVAFTLSANATTNSTIVSINGIVQIPTTAYSVSDDELTFTEAPQTGDLIDVRIVTTTTEVTAISNSPGTAIVQPNPTLAVVDITGDLNPVANVTYNLGSATARWKDLYLSGSSITLGNTVIKNVAGGNTIGFYGPDGTTPATIAASSVDTTTIANGTSSVAVIASGGNIRANVGGSTIGLFYSGGANVTGVLAVSGNIVSTGSNGVANIGSATTYFNTVHAKATSAQYADLAENYAADAEYAPGTVLSFGGANEVTVSTVDGDRRIAGVVSTNPSYVMNAVLEAEHVATIALTGRVPTFVSGPIEKGDMMVSAGNGRAVACATPAIGTVIGKALEDHVGGDGIIEVVVGRL